MRALLTLVTRTRVPTSSWRYPLGFGAKIIKIIDWVRSVGSTTSSETFREKQGLKRLRNWHYERNLGIRHKPPYYLKFGFFGFQTHDFTVLVQSTFSGSNTYLRAKAEIAVSSWAFRVGTPLSSPKSLALCSIKIHFPSYLVPARVGPASLTKAKQNPLTLASSWLHLGCRHHHTIGSIDSDFQLFRTCRFVLGGYRIIHSGIRSVHVDTTRECC